MYLQDNDSKYGDTCKEVASVTKPNIYLHVYMVASLFDFTFFFRHIIMLSQDQQTTYQGSKDRKVFAGRANN